MTPFDGTEYGGEVHLSADTQRKGDLAAILSTLRETHRRRVDLMRASNRLLLQIKAIARRMCDGDKDAANKQLLPCLKGKGDHPAASAFLEWCGPMLDAHDTLETHREAEEKRMEKLAKQLPIAPWVKSVKGLGWLSVAGLVAELGDPGAYSNPAKMWKRMGLAVINGGRQRRVTGDEALIHGYSPERRALVWNIGASLLRAKGEHYSLYRSRVIIEYQKAIDEGLTPATENSQTVNSWRERDLPLLTKVSKIGPEHRGAAHIHNRAQRYIEKRIIRELWRQWRRLG